MRVLNYSLSMLRAQNAAVEELSNEIANIRQSPAMWWANLKVKLLTELFNLLNASFSAHPKLAAKF